MLNVIGGSYIENCLDPPYSELYGSGLRAAAALSQKGFDITFHSAISDDLKELAILKSKTFGYIPKYWSIPQTIEFDYYHPLSFPKKINFDEATPILQLSISVRGDFLYYGMVEAEVIFQGNFVVYDPQNYKKFKDTGSTANHLAIILNSKEAFFFSSKKNDDLVVIGKELLQTESADVIVIKNGANGALVFDKQGVYEIPVFQTSHVWPIGSGDVFTAIFSWKWIIEKKSARDAAYYASQMTAQYCFSEHLPVIEPRKPLIPREIKAKKNNLYLAGPFFTVAEKWLINEVRNLLIDFGNNVFSPYHDVGVLDTKNIKNDSVKIAKKNLNALTNSNVILAIISGLDAGTIFEIGYAKAINKRVVVLAQNVNENDLTMLYGTGCELTNDLSTAIYMASW